MRETAQLTSKVKRQQKNKLKLEQKKRDPLSEDGKEFCERRWE